MRPARILIVASSFPPASFSEGLVTGKLALALLDAGCDVRIVTRADSSLPRYGASNGPPWGSLLGRTHTVRYPMGGLVSRWADILRGAAALGALLPGTRWASRALREALALHAAEPFDIVLSRSPDDSGHLPAEAFALRTGVPWVANWDDPPALRWPAPYPSARGIHAVECRRVLARMMRRATLNTFPSERLRDYIVDGVGIGSHSRTAIIPHIAPPAELIPPRRPSGVFRICHAGNLSIERDPAVLFDGVARFLGSTGERNRFRLQFLGAHGDRVADCARSHGIEDITESCLPVPYAESLSQLVACDAALLVEAPLAEGIFLPSKLADYSAAGLPVLAVSPVNGVVADLLATLGGGILADCRDSGAVARGLWELYDAWGGGRLGAVCPTARLAAHFSPTGVLESYRCMLAPFLSGAGAGIPPEEGQGPE